MRALAFSAHGFTQSGVGTVVGSGIPMGHEWLTRLSALEVMGDARFASDDPRARWTKGRATPAQLDVSKAAALIRQLKARKTTEGRYRATYGAVLDAIVGERWVDIGGFNVSKGFVQKFDCFDAVAQQPAEIQYDHFMRRFDEHGPAGAIQAISRSRARFKTHFINAAMAKAGMIKVYDGGGYSAETTVDRPSFLLGRALHLFQDAFSPEHVVRIPTDNYVGVKQIKSYLCATGAEQHNHTPPKAWNYNNNRDCIWTKGGTGWASYKASSMAPVALVALEGSKHVWAAFLRARATPEPQRRAAAMREADAIVNTWMAYNDGEVKGWYNNPSRRDGTYVIGRGETGKGVQQAACVKGLKVPSGNALDKVRELQTAQRACIYNVVPKDARRYPDRDPYLHIPYYWQWRSSVSWQAPPATWRIPSN